jgi:hypothetical protein
MERIKKALVYGGDTHDWDDVREKLLKGEYQIFWNDFGCVVTEIVEYPKLKNLHWVIIAGTMGGADDLHEKVRRFAVDQGCKTMTGSGRLGWERVSQGFGWKKQWVVMKFELED